MATPKGLRAIKLPVNGTDAVHVYSDDHRIWLQLRRFVPTERDIGRPSFKAALNLTPDTARKLGLELLNAAERSKAKTPPAKKPSPATKHAPAKAKPSASTPTPK